ncbi:MAG: hypothetical protein WDO15_22070 [Bacteroidota bacterium]
MKPDDAASDHPEKNISTTYTKVATNISEMHGAYARLWARVVRNQNLRLAGMKKEERTQEILEAIIFDDVKEFEIKDVNTGRAPLGFHTKKN